MKNQEKTAAEIDAIEEKFVNSIFLNCQVVFLNSVWAVFIRKNIYEKGLDTCPLYLEPTKCKQRTRKNTILCRTKGTQTIATSNNLPTELQKSLQNTLNQPKHLIKVITKTIS